MSKAQADRPAVLDLEAEHEVGQVRGDHDAVHLRDLSGHAEPGVHADAAPALRAARHKIEIGTILYLGTTILKKTLTTLLIVV